MKLAKKPNIALSATSHPNSEASHKQPGTHAYQMQAPSGAQPCKDLAGAGTQNLERHLRKNSQREGSGAFQNTQPLNLNSLGLSLIQDKPVLLSESQPYLAKANEKPNIQLQASSQQLASNHLSNLNQSTNPATQLVVSSSHRRNPSQQYAQQISLNEIPISSLSGSSGSAYMLKLQKYKKMKSELTNQQAKNVIKKCVTGGHSQMVQQQNLADTQIASLKQTVMLNSQPSQKQGVNNSLSQNGQNFQNLNSTTAINAISSVFSLGQNNNGHHSNYPQGSGERNNITNTSGISISQSTKHQNSQQIIFAHQDKYSKQSTMNQTQQKTHQSIEGSSRGKNSVQDYQGKENSNIVANSQHYMNFKASEQTIKASQQNSNNNYQGAQSSHSIKSQTLKFSINNLLNEITSKSGSNTHSSNQNAVSSNATIKPPSSKAIAQSMQPANFNEKQNDSYTHSSLQGNNNHIQNKLMMQSIIAAKNHSTLLNNSKAVNVSSQANNNSSSGQQANTSKGHVGGNQQQLVSSKMMMALHKKCNSISNPQQAAISGPSSHMIPNSQHGIHPQAMNYKESSSALVSKQASNILSKPPSSNVTQLIILDQENLNQQVQEALASHLNSQQQSPKMEHASHQYYSNQMLHREKRNPSSSTLLSQNYSSNQNAHSYQSQQVQSQQQLPSRQQSKKNLGLNYIQGQVGGQAVSQIEFFDENVRVNQVPQITPRHTDKRKTLAANAPNDRYKHIQGLQGGDNLIITSSQQNFVPPPLSVKNIESNYQSNNPKKQNSNANRSNSNTHHQSDSISDSLQQIIENNYYSRKDNFAHTKQTTAQTSSINQQNNQTASRDSGVNSQKGLIAQGSANQGHNKRHSSYQSSHQQSLAAQPKKQTQSNASLKIEKAYQSNPHPIQSQKVVNPNNRYTVEESSGSICEQDENLNIMNAGAQSKFSLQNDIEKARLKLNQIQKQQSRHHKAPSAVQIDLIKNISNEEGISSRGNFEMKRRSCGPGITQEQDFQSKSKLSQVQKLYSPSTSQINQYEIQQQAPLKQNYSSNNKNNQQSHLTANGDASARANQLISSKLELKSNNNNVTGGFGLRKFSQQSQQQPGQYSQTTKINFRELNLHQQMIEEDENEGLQSSRHKPQAEGVRAKRETSLNEKNNIAQNYQSNPVAFTHRPIQSSLLNHNPKEEIVNFFSKYIKQNKPEMIVKADEVSNAGEYEETIQNLRDFLQYLEDKNIINCKKLENDKEEMTNLIQDLMKLDLNKFANSNLQGKSNSNGGVSLTCKNSPTHHHSHHARDIANGSKSQYHSKKNSYDSLNSDGQGAQVPGLQIPSNPPPLNFGQKRNSADFFNQKQQSNHDGISNNQNDWQQQQQHIIQSPSTYGINHDKYRSIPRNKNKVGSSNGQNDSLTNNKNNSYKHKLPLNSPNQDYNSNGKRGYTPTAGSAVLSNGNITNSNSRAGSLEHASGSSGNQQFKNGSNIVCYYAPVSVNGNNNIVSTNFSVPAVAPHNQNAQPSSSHPLSLAQSQHQLMQSQISNSQKAFNCSQRLFNQGHSQINSNKNSFELEQQLEQLKDTMPQSNIHDLLNLKQSQMLLMQQSTNLSSQQHLLQQSQPIFFQHKQSLGAQSNFNSNLSSLQQLHPQMHSAGQGHKRVNSIGSGIQSKKNSNDSSSGLNSIFTPTSHSGGKFNAQLNFGFGNASQVNHLQQRDVEQQQQMGYLNQKQHHLKQNSQSHISAGDQQQQQQQQKQSKEQSEQMKHFHQRKNSHFLQQQVYRDVIEADDQGIQLRNKFYNPQNPVKKQPPIKNSRYEGSTDSEESKELISQRELAINQEDAAAFEIQNTKSRLTHRRATTNFVQPYQSQQLIVMAAKNIQPPQMPQSTSNHQIVSQNGQAIFNDDIGLIEERDKLINYLKLYTSKHINSIPTAIPVTTLDYYKFLKLIGKGAFGKVTLGIHKLTGKQVAIKTVDKALMKDEYQRKKVLQEVQLLKKVRHQNVIRLLEVFESPKHLLMVMEYAGGGDLLQYVKKRRRLEEDEARNIFKQVVYGLAHCHCRSVLHRDIKLDNILLDNEGEIKICDFGVSRIIKKSQRITEQCGTPAYIAPEIISDAGYEGFAADIWSLGVLLYAMLCGTVPFKAQNMHDLHQIITSGEFSYPPQVEPLLSSESKELISRMLVLEPTDRISIPEILSHPWMVGNKDDLLLQQQDQEDMIDFTNGTFHNRNFTMGSANFPSHSINETQNPNSNVEPDINQVQIDNLFPNQRSYKTKLSYSDYCAITQDFATMYMNEEALQVMEGMGLPRKAVREGLNKGELNHATATYNLLVLN